jgi:hypothetical protein
MPAWICPPSSSPCANSLAWGTLRRWLGARSFFAPPPSPGVLGKYSRFRVLAAWICRKHIVFRYLEPKNLKTQDLCGILCVLDTNTGLWFRAQYTTPWI